MVAADGALEGTTALLNTGFIAGILSKSDNRQEDQGQRLHPVRCEDIHSSDVSYNEVG